MKTPYLIGLILVLVLSGCIDAGLTERVYQGGGDKIVLSPDYTYRWYDTGHNYVWTGAYKEDSKTILFILNPPLPAIEMTKNGTNLTYHNQLWVLQ
jgi:hypothetical protein